MTELGPNGSNLVYSTYLGGNGSDAAYGIAVNSLGNTARVWRLSATSTHREPEPVLHPPPRSQWSLMAVLPRSGDIVVYFQPFQGSAPLYVIDMSQSQWRTTTMPSWPT